jgi:tellurite resistance protein TerC
MTVASTLTLAASGSSTTFVNLDIHLWEWAALIAFTATLLMVDLLVIHREARVITFREAVVETAVWISIGVSFTGVIWLMGSQQQPSVGGAAAGEYISGFLLEQTLSVDNVFVWSVILAYFVVPPKYQFRTLFWGIFGALILRATFIFAGSTLISKFSATLAVFGMILLYSAWKIAAHDDAEVDPEHSLVLRAFRRVIPSSPDYDGQKLFTVRDGRRLATPLFAVLVMVETTDLVFAVDSVPAIFGVAREPFIVFSSNAFAILGLRSLYFCLNGMKDRFEYLNIGLGLILAFVGVKMILTFTSDTFDFPVKGLHLPTWLSLGVIVVILAVTITVSLAKTKGGEAGGAEAEAEAAADERDAAQPGVDAVNDPRV